MRVSLASVVFLSIVSFGSALFTGSAAYAQLPYNYYKQPSQYGYQQPSPYYWGNNPGFYYPNPYAPAYPAYPGGVVQPGMPLPAPVPVAGGMYSIGRGGTQFYFWKSPSGYYYPWVHQPYVYPSTTVIYMQEGSNAPAQPPISTMFSDMKKYLQEAKDKGTISDGAYNHLMLRLSDLTKMEQAAREEGGGALSTGDDSDIRSKLNDLGTEISRSVKG